MAASIDTEPNPRSSYKQYLRHKYNTLFTFQNITTDVTSKLIKGLNSKTSFGYDGISTKLLKSLESVLVRPLTLIIIQSLNTGIFLDKFKITKIIPIHKKDDIHLVNNYRPISLLPSISKLFEKVVYEQLYAYLVNNNYLCQNQYGFRKLHSTEHAVLELVDRIILDLDRGNTPLAIFLDTSISKAFDTLNFDILLYKLEYYGIKSVSLQWFKSYLQNRLQYVQIDYDCKSDINSVNLVVPQGSILGPLLFILYINDIQFSSDFFHFTKYADDTNLVNPLTEIGNENFDTINIKLEKVSSLLNANKLSLNIKKTKFMIFHNIRKNIDSLIPVIKKKIY